jgi:hypothetical protein
MNESRPYATAMPPKLCRRKSSLFDLATSARLTLIIVLLISARGEHASEFSIDDESIETTSDSSFLVSVSGPDRANQILIGVAQASDYGGSGSQRFFEITSHPGGGYNGHLALTKAGRHTLHVSLACCGGLQAAFASLEAPETEAGICVQNAYRLTYRHTEIRTYI